MAPALRMTRSIKEKLPIFLPLFCPLPRPYFVFWDAGWGDTSGGRGEGGFASFFGAWGVGLREGLAYLGIGTV